VRVFWLWPQGHLLVATNIAVALMQLAAAMYSELKKPTADSPCIFKMCSNSVKK